MPRGHKSKLRAREKRRHDRAQTQGLKDAQAAPAVKEEAVSSSSLACWDGPSTSAVGGTVPAPPSVPATTSAAADVSCKRSDGRGRSRVTKSKNSSRASTSTESSGQDLLDRKAGMLVQFLLYKYKMNEPVRKADMLKIIHKRYREQFPEILGKASVSLDLIFGLEMKEVKPNSHSYTLVCNTDDLGRGSLSSAWQFPPRGILMPLLGVIFLRHNSAPEEDIWEILNMWGIYDGKRHVIFGEPRKLIEDLVKEKYLECRQVPYSDPPSFEFLWGSRAHAEISKMKVLEFLSKINGTTPSDFPCHYEQALRDEEQRARATAATMAGTASKSSGVPRATSSR
ncbi:melanoma-associated antigen B4-like [Rhinolophus ferrumequinum]|uniref:melanoma-associated antigen B4-like n=1 Tax=Rhinolophus ferrumequinum TaxID=59479 RepID=UPI00140FD8E9|nr:melanoma-associated antigen B4-like [Rhinolophus ferrumequinum]XP_032957382.1 melanoma-associated antigen B4-like [Rhinolophus ferrumequinum]